MSEKKSAPRNAFLIISTLILAALVIIILVLAVVVVKKAQSGGRLTSPAASPTLPAPTRESQPTTTPMPVRLSATAAAVLEAAATSLPAATPSPLLAATSTPAPIAQVSPGTNTTCRKSPGMYYDAVTYLEVGGSSWS